MQRLPATSRCCSPPARAARYGSASGVSRPALFGREPEVDVLISDDGLQHYALARDMEIAVVDGERRFGNGLLLPAGPLRTERARLTEVDAVVINGGPILGKLRARQFTMTTTGTDLVNVRDPRVSMRPDAFAGKTVFAAAGIGNPDRFFRHLRELGMHVRPQPFPDHYAFSADDLAFAGNEPVGDDAEGCSKAGPSPVTISGTCRSKRRSSQHSANASSPRSRAAMDAKAP